MQRVVQSNQIGVARGRCVQGAAVPVTSTTLVRHDRLAKVATRPTCGIRCNAQHHQHQQRQPQQQRTLHHPKQERLAQASGMRVAGIMTRGATVVRQASADGGTGSGSAAAKVEEAVASAAAKNGSSGNGAAADAGDTVILDDEEHAPAPEPPLQPKQKALRELTKDDFYPFLEEAGDMLVVVDFYTDWCGPCKLILPELINMSQSYAPKATIVKMNCNAKNKELGVKLKVKVAPTFHLYKKSQKVAEMTGAKVDKLKDLIKEHI